MNNITVYRNRFRSCQEICRLSQGKNCSQSEQGVGTTFKVFIPDTKIWFYENEQLVNGKKSSQLQSKNLSSLTDELPFETQNF